MHLQTAHLLRAAAPEIRTCGIQSAAVVTGRKSVTASGDGTVQPHSTEAASSNAGRPSTCTDLRAVRSILLNAEFAATTMAAKLRASENSNHQKFQVEPTLERASCRA